MISPIYLNRNLTYMKERCGRPNAAAHLHKQNGAGTTFRVNSLLSRKQLELQQLLQPRGPQSAAASVNGSAGASISNGVGGGAARTGGFITLMFLGYYDKSVSEADVRVEVETHVRHVSMRQQQQQQRRELATGAAATTNGGGRQQQLNEKVCYT